MEKKDNELPYTPTKSDKKCKDNVAGRYSHGLVCMLLFFTCICILVATSALALSLTQFLAHTDAEFSPGNCSGSIPESQTCNCSLSSNRSEIQNLIEQYRSLQMLVSELYFQYDNLTRLVKNMQNSSTAESCSYERCTVIEATVSDLAKELVNITSILNRAENVRCDQMILTTHSNWLQHHLVMIRCNCIPTALRQWKPPVPYHNLMEVAVFQILAYATLLLHPLAFLGT